MADGIEMINMNFNMNSANMGGIGAVGAAELGQGQAVTEASTLQSMETLASAMTTPGTGDVSSDIMAKIGDSGAGAVNVEGGMNRLDACGSYLDNCERLNGQGPALSGMMDQINGDVSQDLAFYKGAAAEGGVEGGKVPGFASNNKALDGVSQPKPALDAKADAGKVAGAKVSDGSALIDQAPQKAENAARNGQVPVDGVQAPKNLQMAQNSKVPQNAKQGQVSEDLQSAAKQNMATSTKTVKAAEKTVADNNAKMAATKKQEVARQENDAKAAEAKKEAVREELANQDADAEALAKELAHNEVNANPAMFATNGDVSSVLTQYLQQNTDLSASQINTLVSDYAAQADMGNLDALYSSLDQDAAKMADGTYRSVNYNPAEDTPIAELMNNPLNLVGSTAMSTNMANLENLVNMDLMEKFISGAGMTSMGE